MSTDRKKQYIGKAIEILKQEGFRLSLDEMATKMGITKKTLYNNFSSKDELLNPSLTPIGVLVTDFNIIVDFSRVTVYYKF